ncbi:MAG: ABC transporter permease [Acidimicrobiia bacterium]|nr:ABC transporter permease [Acidimicrobiia bacterium]
MSRTMTDLPLRLASPLLLGRPRAPRILERKLMVYRHLWLTFVAGFFEPVFYLLSVRIGIGKLVGDLTISGHTVSYAAFVAPALLAASAMNGAVFDSTFGVFFQLKYQKSFDAILATPVTVDDLAAGEIAWALVRGLMYATAFLVVMVVFGLVHSPLAVLALPGAILIGFAFAAVGLACTSYMRSWQDFEFVQLAILPLFLFSATFYPLSTYPRALQLIVQCTPLYQGVAIERALTTGTVGPDIILHIVYLLAMGLIGLRIASKRMHVLLHP